MKALVIFEHFFPPFDEGVKKFALMVHSAVSTKCDTRLIRDVSTLPNILNSIFLIPRVLLTAMTWRPDRVIFIPKGALTFAGYMKAWILERFFGNRIAIVSVQKKVLSGWQRSIVRRLKLHNVFAFSKSMASELNSLGLDTKILYAGIEREKFKPVEEYGPLRDKYKIPREKPVLLHVGHIRKSRNVSWLGEVQDRLPEIQVVLVGSTTTDQDLSLARELEDKGVIVIKEALPDIHEIYQLSTWYCFPVMIQDAAMETPLSVLEAMSTNLPIITTRFGQLPDMYTEDACFRFIDNVESLVTALDNKPAETCNNRSKTEAFTWQRTAELLIE